jgi:uncharacterized repeat protein (TIGR01451 family)
MSAAHAAVLNTQSLFNSGLSGAEPLAVSPDSSQVYVGSATDGGLSVFQRDGTGSFNSSAVYAAADVSGSAAAQSLLSLTVSPDGKFVYAGYEAADGSAARIAVLSVDSSGVLTMASSVMLDGSTRLSALAVSPDGAYLYAVDKDNLYVYGRDGSTGTLSLLQQLTDNIGGVDGLGGAWAIAVSPDSHYIYVSGAADNAVAVLSRDAGGPLSFVDVYKDGVGGVSGIADARGMALSPDGAQLYVAAAGDNAVSVFNRDSATGTLQPLQTYQAGTPGFDALAGAAAVTLSPQGSQVYVLGSGEDALTVLRRDSVDGSLTQVAVLRQALGTPVVDGLSTAFSVAATPDGKQLLVTSPLDNSLAVFGVAESDLNLVMQADSTTLTAGNTAQFQLIVTNNGPDAASGVMVSELLSAGTGAATGSFGSSQCNQDTAQLSCAVGILSPGQQLTITVGVKFPSEGAFINSAVVVADQRDPDTTDNRDQVTLQIDPSLNQPPVAEPDQAATLPGVAVDIPVMANDHDPEGNGISLSAVPAASQQGAGLSLNGDGSVHYVPVGGFHGVDTFSYTIADSEGATAQGEVQVTVNTPPDAQDDTAVVAEGSAATIYVLVNDVDADDDTLNVVAVPSSSDKGGVVSINGDGGVSYTPAAAFSGTDSFIYTVSDGNGGTDTAQVTLTVAVGVAQGTSSGFPNKPSEQSTQDGGGGSMRFNELLMLALMLLACRGRGPSRSNGVPI